MTTPSDGSKYDGAHNEAHQGCCEGRDRPSGFIFPKLAEQLQLFNTMSRASEPLTPRKPGEVSVYCCGPTVYDYPHIGNMRTYLFEDLLVRTLRGAGYRVVHAMNITDVGHLVSDADEGEDKMALAVKREGKKSADIAQFYTNIFWDHSQKLNITRPDVVCKATDHIQEMIDLIRVLQEKGFAYQSGGNVYFDIGRFDEYGKLANINVAEQLAGARIEADERKRSPLDFALWFTDSKFVGQELQWDSPWGRGYPGWHIECSAMAIKHVGEYIDIHCGGIDHIGAHHTNEIAQSECAIGHRWVQSWMHGAFLVDATGKMSKSKGKFLTVQSLVDEGLDPLAYRLFCLGAHYRSPLTLSMESIGAAQTSLERLRQAVVSLKESSAPAAAASSEAAQSYLAAFEKAIGEDLNAPRALAVLWGVVGDRTLPAATALELIAAFDSILGLNLMSATDAAAEEVPEVVLALVQQREDARRARDWSASDRLRSEVLAMGYEIKDTAQGTTLVKGPRAK
jgi:cysteinyl-tRNA synthetase